MIGALASPSLARRLVVGLAAWLAAALVVGGTVLALAFRDAAERAFDSRLDAMLVALIAACKDGLPPSRPLGDPRFELPLSGWYWQVADDAAALARSRSLWDESLPVAPPAGAPVVRRDALGPRDQKLRIVERDIDMPYAASRLHFLVAATVDERVAEIERFDRWLALSLAGLSALFLGGAVVQVGYGLGPLRRLARSIEAVNAGRATRLTGAFPAEVEALADATNVLLAQHERSVARARNRAADLAHGIKTPLSVLAAALDSVEGADAASCRSQIESIRRLLDHQLARAAAGGPVPGSRTSALPVVRQLCGMMERLHAARGISFALVDPLGADGIQGPCFLGDREDLLEMLGNLLDNAGKWATSSVRVSAGRIGAVLRIDVEDDGPGIPESERQRALARGQRLSRDVPGSGFGLAIVREIAELYRGDLELDGSPLGGLRARLSLPGAP